MIKPPLKKQASIKTLTKRAQTVFNAWIRKRDEGKGCISCVTGGVHNAGHYYHAHLYSAVRFNEMNCNGQCVPCNLGKGGNEKGYRQGLVKRYGERSVLELENSVAIRAVSKYSRFELEAILKIYK